MNNSSQQKIFTLIAEIKSALTKLELVFFTPYSEKPTKVKTNLYQTENFPSIRECLTEFLEEFKDTSKWPQCCLIAVNGAPYEDCVEIPEINWPEIKAREIETEFGIALVKIINDFTAVGHSVTKISNQDLKVIQSGEKVEGGTSIIVGCSQYLGECIIRPSKDSETSFFYQICETQGGLKQFTPTNSDEWEYYQFVMEQTPYLQEEYGYLPLEKAFCGDAIVRIYNFICKKENATPKNMSSGEILIKGLHKKDIICEKAIQFMAHLFGNEISNFAVDNLPTGGIYLVGGVTKMMFNYITGSPENSFMEGYLSKGAKVNETLSKFPIYFVDKEDLITSGCYMELKKMIIG